MFEAYQNFVGFTILDLCKNAIPNNLKFTNFVVWDDSKEWVDATYTVWIDCSFDPYFFKDE